VTVVKKLLESSIFSAVFFIRQQSPNTLGRSSREREHQCWCWVCTLFTM